MRATFGPFLWKLPIAVLGFAYGALVIAALAQAAWAVLIGDAGFQPIPTGPAPDPAGSADTRLP